MGDGLRLTGPKSDSRGDGDAMPRLGKGGTGGGDANGLSEGKLDLLLGLCCGGRLGPVAYACGAERSHAEGAAGVADASDRTERRRDEAPTLCALPGRG